MAFHIRQGSNWKKINMIHFRLNNVWKKATKLWYRKDGQWKVIWTSDPSWSAWSGWYDRPIQAIANQREVKSETQHKYQRYETCYNFAEYFSPRWCWNKTSTAPDCNTCNYRKLPQEWGHYRGSWTNENGEYHCWAQKMFDSGVRWGCNGVKDAHSDWTSGSGGADTDVFKVTATRTAYAYRDNLNDPPNINP